MKYLLILLFTTVSIFAQAQYKMKYGKISDEDVKMTTYEADPNVDAVVLGEEMNVLFTIRNGKLMLTYHYHTRIKILTKKGADRANISVAFWSNRRSERIAKIKAQTLNWKGGKIVKTEVGKKDFFTEKKNEYRSAKKFAFPAVEIGSVLEYYYELDSDYFTSINDFFFQQDIPVIWSSYKVKVHNSLNYRFDVQGTHPMTKQTQKPVTLNQAEGLSGREYYWLMTNIPALKKEPYITSMYDYYTGVKMRLASYEPDAGFHRNFIGTWPQMNALYFEEIAENNFLKENYSNVIWNAAKGELNSVTKELDKVEVLYKFVKEHIKNNGVEEINPDHTADYCYKYEKGSNSEINLTLLSLLKKAKIQAYPLLVTTRDHGKPMNFLPYLYQFNQTLIVVIINEKAYYLDASNENYPMNILPPNNLNKEGWMIENKQKGQWIAIPESKSVEIVLPTLTISKDGSVSGTITALSRGYAAYDAREMIREESKEEYIQETYLSDAPNSKIKNHRFSELEAIDKKLKETMDITSTDMVEVAGDLIYFDPFLKVNFSTNPFKTEKREIPVDMPYGMDKQYILKITIPEGYAVDELPKGMKVTLPNDGGSFIFAISQKDNEIQVVSKVKIRQTYFQPEEYSALKQFIDLIIEKQQEQIVLSKKG